MGVAASQFDITVKVLMQNLRFSGLRLGRKFIGDQLKAACKPSNSLETNHAASSFLLKTGSDFGHKIPFFELLKPGLPITHYHIEVSHILTAANISVWLRICVEV